MKKKGFTLIELLAVIVVLAIIALIAVPVILNIIEKSKLGSAESSGLGYIDAVEKQVAINSLDKSKENIQDGVYTVQTLANTYAVKVKGQGPSGGSVVITKGNVTACSLQIGDYVVNCKNKGNKVKTNKGTELEDIGVETTPKAYTVGELVYFDPVSTDTCSEATYTGTNTCYKWRVIEPNDDTIKTNITLQMDHNLINMSAWVNKADYVAAGGTETDYGNFGNNNKGPITSLKKLNTATASWSRVGNLNYEYDTTLSANNYRKMTCTNGACTLNGVAVAGVAKARMITGEELAAIINTKVTDETANSRKWTLASLYSDYYYFSNTGYITGTKNSGTGNIEFFSWLIENTREYEASGATSYRTENTGYWTLSPISGGAIYAWYVNRIGFVSRSDVYSENVYGVRPVINIPKSKI